MTKYSIDDTIAAISTPVGEGGIGIVRISGQQAIAVADAVLQLQSAKKLAECKSHSVHHGLVYVKDDIIYTAALTLSGVSGIMRESPERQFWN